jgi:hypothetical protein
LIAINGAFIINLWSSQQLSRAMDTERYSKNIARCGEVAARND